MWLCDNEIQLRYQVKDCVFGFYVYIYSHMSAKIVVQLLFCNKYIFEHKQCWLEKETIMSFSVAEERH